jgi:Zn-dependent protease with chaperone function
LEPDQLRAVLAHERAHLAGHHSFCVGLATVLDNAFGWLAPVFSRAERETKSLIEMAADDAAVRMCPPERLVEALLRLADGGSPATTFAATGSNLMERIERLYSHPRPLSPLHRLAGFVSLAVVLMVPIVTVFAAVAAAVLAASCPPSA